MLKVLSDVNEIAVAQDKFKKSLSRHLSSTIPVIIGYQSGSVDATVSWFSTIGIWGYWGLPPDDKSAGKRYWNAFGIGKPTPLVSIVCEINPSIQGINPRVAGAFALSPAGAISVLHRGRFNVSGGMKMIFFERNYPKPYIKALEGSKISRFIHIGDLDDPSFGKELSGFIYEVDRIKNLARSK